MRQHSRHLALLPVVVVALWARLAPYAHVFAGPHPAILGDSDAHYHVLRAERMLVGAPGAPWRDPSLDWPRGADILWPPLFDALLAGAGRAASGPVVERDALVAAAAFVPVVLGVIVVLLTAMLARRLLGTGAGWISALVVAVVAAGVDPSRVGRTDQHVLEMALFAALLVAFAPGGRRPGFARGDASAAALAVALAFWSWQGSALYLLVLVAATIALHVQAGRGDDPAGDRAAGVLAAAGLGGALLLALSIALLGRPGALASWSIKGIGALHVAMAATAGAFGLLLLGTRRRWPAAGRRARALAALACAGVPGAVLLAFPSVRAGIGRGLDALVAGNAWYASIDEFRPLLSGIPAPAVGLALVRGYGLTFLVVPLLIAAFARAWRRGSVRRGNLLTVAVVFVAFVLLTLARRRFGVYAILPLAVATELGIREGVALLRGRIRALRARRWREVAAVVAAIAVVAPAVPEHGLPDSILSFEKISLLRWIGGRPTVPGREGVLAPWSYGHLIQFFAGRPVLTSPFGTDGGDSAMQAAAAFWHSTEQADAVAALEARRVGLVLLGPVLPETATLQGFAAPGTPAAIVGEMSSPEDWRPTERLWSLVPMRLYYVAGSACSDGPALDRFRLLSETPTTSPDDPPTEERWMLFEPVAGAVLRVADARGTVRAAVTVVTDAGRTLEWTTEAAADENGVATLRVPYASGRNGAVWARACRISGGGSELELVLHEEDVVTGRTVDVRTGTGQAGPAASARASSSSSSRATRAASSSNSAR